MSDYMKGYSSRNKRRRASISHSKNTYGKKSGNYRKRQNTSALMKVFGIAIRVVLIAVVAILFIRFCLPGNTDSGNSTQVASGSVTTTVVTEVKKSDTGDTAGAENSANQATTSAVAQANSTAIPGGVSETVAAVGTLAPNAIASPSPRPRSKAIALTFDDGPNTVNTPKILATLKKYNAHATFFVVGSRVAAGGDILKQEIAQGCEIANHSWDHSNLSLLGMDAVNKQYNKTANLVKKVTGGYQIQFIRPPYGAISDLMRKQLKHPMVLWNVDTLDWKTRNAKSVIKEVKKSVADGDIILMHDLYDSTSEAIKKLIPWLQKQDYDILTVSELMERNGIKMKNGKAYGSARK